MIFSCIAEFCKLETEKTSCENTVKPSLKGMVDSRWVSKITRNPRSCALWTNRQSECSSKFFYSPLNGDCSCEKDSSECKPYWTLDIVRQDINQYRVAKGNIDFICIIFRGRIRS